MNCTFYYSRVPSSEQNLGCQLAVFAKLGADDGEIDTDKETGRSSASYTEPRSGCKIDSVNEHC